GITGASMETAYSASKGAVNALTKALGKELAPSHIRVNAIACGLIDTEMNNHLSSEELQEIISEIPADRIGKPEEVASLVLHLIHAPEYLTGQIITMDGGWI
ncbi:MAG: SDR family oxidoreductase, partial [Lachnospiraceae bacterium]|nr:SDR family oxidoreductase [Lachnospiraceae bacterium]